MDQVTTFIKYISISKFDRKEVLPVVSIAAAASIFYASYIVLYSGQKKHKFKEIPVPESFYPYVGHTMSLGRMPGKTVAKWHDELGPIIKLKMGVQDWIMISDPTLAHKVFVLKGAETSYRPHNVFGHDHYGIGGMGITFSQPDGHWKVARAAALSVLGSKRVKNYIPSIQRESKKLVNRFIETSENEDGVNPFVYLELNSMNVMCNSTFGRSFDSIRDPEFVKLTHIVDVTMNHCALENDLTNFLPILSVYDYFFGNQSEQKSFIKNERNPFFRQLVKEAQQAEVPNVVKSLVEDGFVLTDDETMVFTTELMIAGTETVSVTLSWNIAILCHYPDVQYKIFAEIDKFIELNGRIPHFSERSHLPYCISVMKECMRYRPVTPFGVPHTTQEDLYIDDYIIPKGSNIISSMEGMHRRADLYPNPEEFIPERFMNNLKTMQSAANGRLEDRDHFNFGWGRRMCPAVHLAETEIFSAFVQIYSRCFIEPTSDGFPDIDDARLASLTTSPVSYKVKFTKRASALV